MPVSPRTPTATPQEGSSQPPLLGWLVRQLEKLGPASRDWRDSPGDCPGTLLSASLSLVGPLGPSWPPYLECVPLVEGQFIALCGLETVQGHGLHPAAPEPQQLGAEQRVVAASCFLGSQDCLPLF